MSVFREEVASKAKRAINWEATQILPDGIYLEWRQKAQYRNAYDWFARLLRPKLNDEEWDKYEVRRHMTGFDPAVAANPEAAPKDSGDAAAASDAPEPEASAHGPASASAAAPAPESPLAGKTPPCPGPNTWCPCACLQVPLSPEMLRTLGKRYTLEWQDQVCNWGSNSPTNFRILWWT